MRLGTGGTGQNYPLPKLLLSAFPPKHNERLKVLSAQSVGLKLLPHSTVEEGQSGMVVEVIEDKLSACVLRCDLDGGDLLAQPLVAASAAPQGPLTSFLSRLLIPMGSLHYVRGHLLRACDSRGVRPGSGDDV
jgi:hypothetical protein